MKPNHKFNSGKGATICNHCSVIMSIGIKSNRLLCYKCLEKYIFTYPTKNKQGFTHSEMLKLVYDLHLGKDRFLDQLGINTAMVIEGEWVTYHEDVFRTANMIMDGREMYGWEWD